MVFPVVMNGCESWRIKKAEGQRIDAFKLWCWRRLLRVPWSARRSYQSILNEINPEYSWEGLMLKLKLQFFGHLMQKVDSLEKTLMLGKVEGRKRRGQQRMRWLDGIINLMDMSLSKAGEIVKDREARHATVHKVAKSWTQLSNWTTTTSTTTMTWIVSPTMCWSPNHQYPWVSNKVCGWNQVKMRSLGWAFNHCGHCFCRRRTSGHRHTQRRRACEDTARGQRWEDGGRNWHAATRSWKSQGRVIPGAS